MNGKIYMILDRFGGVRFFTDIKTLCRKMNLPYKEVKHSVLTHGEWLSTVYLVKMGVLERNELRNCGHLKPYTDSFRG
jgi:hypothetical protein